MDLRGKGSSVSAGQGHGVTPLHGGGDPLPVTRRRGPRPGSKRESHPPPGPSRVRAKQCPEGRSQPLFISAASPARTSPATSVHRASSARGRRPTPRHPRHGRKPSPKTPLSAGGTTAKAPLCRRETEAWGARRSWGARGVVGSTGVSRARSRPVTLTMQPLLSSAGTGLSPPCAGQPARPHHALSPRHGPVLCALRAHLSPICTFHSSLAASNAFPGKLLVWGGLRFCPGKCTLLWVCGACADAPTLPK